MTKRVKKEFTANFNGEAIKLGEVMVPFEFTELEGELTTNSECIKTIRQGGRNFKVIYKAVPEEWAKDAKAAFNLTQNEQLGHYSVPDSVSLDKLQEDEWDGTDKEKRSYVESPVEALMEELTTFEELITGLINKSPKIGYAVLLMFTGVKGDTFYGKMKLSRTPANLVRKQAEGILYKGLANLDLNGICGYKNRYDDEYRTEAFRLLDQIIKMFR